MRSRRLFALSVDEEEVYDIDCRYCVFGVGDETEQQ